MNHVDKDLKEKLKSNEKVTKLITTKTDFFLQNYRSFEAHKSTGKNKFSNKEDN